MEWLVASDKAGTMMVMTRECRETLLGYWLMMEILPPTFVLKVCDSREEAEKYILKIKEVNEYLNNLDY